jgi:DNA-binding transcriptional MerR regulator
MVSGFTRQEMIALTGVSSSKLSYYDRTGLIVPTKFGSSKHPRVIYRWEQILEIKTIKRLQEQISLQEIRKVLDFLRGINYHLSFFSHSLVFVNSKLYLLENERDFGIKVLEASGENKGQVVIKEIGAIGDIITELWKEAEKHQVLDFDKRAGAKPLILMTLSSVASKGE